MITREWWRDALGRFRLVASELVIAEAGSGDADAARARLEALESITLIGVTAKAEKLGRKLLDAQAVPYQAVAYAAHIAVAVANGVNHLVTWNFRHISNTAMRVGIERICRRVGDDPPVICNPNELLETDDASD